jgi:hypothetical protein
VQLVAWLSLVGFLAFFTAPLWVYATIDGWRRVRGRPAVLTRTQFVAKYRFLAMFCALLPAYWATTAPPALLFGRGSSWGLIGVPLGLVFFILVPKPTAPPGRIPTIPDPPAEGQGIVLVRLHELFPIFSSRY